MEDNRLECYIRNMITGTTSTFYVVPDEVSDSVTSNYESEEIRGRSSPIKGYNSTSARVVSYTLELHDDYCKDGILATVNFLRALAYPNYGGTITPPRCYVRLGTMVAMQAVVTSVATTWQLPIRNNVYIRASVSLELEEVTSSPASAYQIQSGTYNPLS